MASSQSGAFAREGGNQGLGAPKETCSKGQGLFATRSAKINIAYDKTNRLKMKSLLIQTELLITNRDTPRGVKMRQAKKGRRDLATSVGQRQNWRGSRAIVKRDFRKSKHFNIRREFNKRILIDFKLRIPCLEAPKGNLVPKLVGGLASVLKVIAKPLRLLVGGHNPPLPPRRVAPLLLPSLLGLLRSQARNYQLTRVGRQPFL
ncbi:hypothetical protein B296_00048899 [Ensete ventricosum]|uniref:Uncharacterized protein n=1 Tax=Ensete ventricosum TaxID=4639 RepID=A0A426YSU1_ENSVE|nr:hypothetical protein B296_00048899 [Ensete ventricosum]